MDKFTCCGRQVEYSLLKRSIAPGDGTALRRYCKECVSGNGPAVPDVYLGKATGVITEENICDPKTGKPIPFYDKASKKAAMEIAGIREAGDKVHGARPDNKRATYFT